MAEKNYKVANQGAQLVKAPQSVQKKAGKVVKKTGNDLRSK